MSRVPHEPRSAHHSSVAACPRAAAFNARRALRAPRARRAPRALALTLPTPAPACAARDLEGLDAAHPDSMHGRFGGFEADWDIPAKSVPARPLQRPRRSTHGSRTHAQNAS
eukprot:357881-Chlamydomonas_euryale.AAC.23